MEKKLLASTSSLIASVGSGMTAAFTSTLLPQIHQYVDEEMGSWLASIRFLCQLVGVFVGSVLMRKFGRRPFLIFLNIPSFLGWICLSMASSTWIFFLGALIVGITSGFSGFLATIYVIEISKPDYRGLFGALDNATFFFGIFLQNLIGTVFLWRTALQIIAFIPFLTFFVAIYAPESPNWLILNRYPDKAKENFSWLRNVYIEEDEEFADLVTSCSDAINRSDKSITNDILSKQFFSSLFVVLFMMTAAVVSGFYSITVYSVNIIMSMSKELDAQWATVLTNAFGVISCSISCVVIERVPRRLLYFSSGFGVLLSLLAIVFIMALNLPRYLLMVSLCCYHIAGSMGLFVMPWLLAGEIFSDATRDLGAGLSLICFNVMAFSLVKMYPFLLQFFGIQMMFLSFACFLAICLTILYFKLPETRGYTLQQVEQKLKSYNN